MKIQLKNVKYAKFASQETNCFEATVYIDGVKQGFVTNEGRGGPNSYSPWTLQTKLDDYGKTLPLIVTEWPDPKDPTGFMTLQPDADILIGDAFEIAIREKDFKRAVTSRILFVNSKGELMQTRTMTAAERETVMARPLALKDCQTILNKLPFDEALALYVKAGAA